jgi:hypothetical protein
MRCLAEMWICNTREVPLYLILANPDFAGPGVRRLVDILTESVTVKK